MFAEKLNSSAPTDCSFFIEDKIHPDLLDFIFQEVLKQNLNALYVGVVYMVSYKPVDRKKIQEILSAAHQEKKGRNT